MQAEREFAGDLQAVVDHDRRAVCQGVVELGGERTELGVGQLFFAQLDEQIAVERVADGGDQLDERAPAGGGAVADEQQAGERGVDSAGHGSRRSKRQGAIRRSVRTTRRKRA